MTITTTFVTVLRRFKYLAEKVMYSNHYSSLSTFFNHYLEVENVCEPFDLILYTNQKLDFEAEKEQIVFEEIKKKIVQDGDEECSPV
jgi:hypothetical protein